MLKTVKVEEKEDVPEEKAEVVNQAEESEVWDKTAEAKTGKDVLNKDVKE